jgi:hypothetical protein
MIYMNFSMSRKHWDDYMIERQRRKKNRRTKEGREEEEEQKRRGKERRKISRKEKKGKSFTLMKKCANLIMLFNIATILRG